MYNFGDGVKQDKEEANKWYHKAVDQGLAVAQYKLGDMYYKGLGVEWNYADGVKWCREAAKQGFAPAQTALGMIYSYGMATTGVWRDYDEAFK